MATLTGGTQYAINMAAPVIPSLFDYDDFSFSPTELRFFNEDGDFTSITGENFSVNLQGQVTGGTIHQIEVDDDNVDIQLLLTGLHTGAKQISDLLFAGQFEQALALLFAGNDSLRGTPLKDNLNGYAGDDTINGAGGHDTQFGGDGDDVLSGGAGNDDVFGGDGADRVNGAKGNDKLHGEAGRDSLNGGVGADQLIFDTPGGQDNFDRIFGFQKGTDKIVLDSEVFTALTGGNLDADAFRIHGQAGDAEDRIVFIQDSGKIVYDANGGGSADGIVVAQVSSSLTLAATDFFVI